MLKHFLTRLSTGLSSHLALFRCFPDAYRYTCCAPLLILHRVTVNTPAAAPHSIAVIKNRENKRRINGSCRVHVYVFPNSAKHCYSLLNLTDQVFHVVFHVSDASRITPRYIFSEARLSAFPSIATEKRSRTVFSKLN